MKATKFNSNRRAVTKQINIVLINNFYNVLIRVIQPSEIGIIGFFNKKPVVKKVKYINKN